MVNVNSIRNISYFYLILASGGLLVEYAGIFSPGRTTLFAVAFIFAGSLTATIHAVLKEMNSKIRDLEQQIRLIRSNA